MEIRFKWSIAFIAGMLAASPAFSETSAAWQAQCLAGDVQLTVDFKSTSGDAWEDDMSITIHHVDGRSAVVPVPPALYVPRGMMGNLPNHCDQIGALDAGNGTWLLLLTRDNRPSYPVLDAVLFNPQTMTVTDVQRGIGVRSGLGGIKTERLVLRQNGEPQHYAVRLISDYIENADCDCADAFIEGWLRLFTDNEHIRQEWIQ